ncbi:hypothetical protein BGZ76_003815 [Entomortierella beljakovae]|nr:hypothetical protein BGZ76_003815 [Entomortierella beljakovae]
MCIDRNGGFILSSGYSQKNVPEVNLMSSVGYSDVYWQPRVERTWGSKMKAHYVDDTVFVHSLFSPFHFSHWLYNGMMPLYSTMRQFGGTKDSWTFRPDHYKNDPIERQGTWEMDHFFHTGKELVLTQYEIATSFQSLPPPDAPICFKKAVVGLGSQCALNYCEKNIPTEVYQSFRDEIADYYWKSPQTWQLHLGMMQRNIDKEQRTGKQQGADEVHSEEVVTNNTPIRCLELARYYNFGGASKSPLSERSSRVGQRHPDFIDLESDSLDNAYNGIKQKLVVGIIQREKSRRLINDQDLVDALVKAGFRVKWITFDHGCGIPETAYLLRDINVLVSPHGNALGASIFMPTNLPVSTIVSADSSIYWEGWFVYTTTVLGQRFVSAACGPTSYRDEATKNLCPLYTDLNLARELLKNSNIIFGLPKSMIKSDGEKDKMSRRALDKMRSMQREYVESTPSAKALEEEEIELFMKAQYPNELKEKYGEDIIHLYGNYWKELPRYADVSRLVQFVESLQKDFKLEKEKADNSSSATPSTGGINRNAQYLEYTREGRSCSIGQCQEIMSRNVGGKLSAYGRYSLDNLSKWGQQNPESKNFLQGLDNFNIWEVQV